MSNVDPETMRELERIEDLRPELEKDRRIIYLEACLRRLERQVEQMLNIIDRMSERVGGRD